ncbi:P-loop nucleotide/nucleoside kinase family protein [Microlunatus parietis]|uniref:Putative kinase n=1 Tax=Microlunatus parietis TaxID=682979 RepID=A0A7Y9I213_9ACTN|nr:ATP-binding protein [Microlunatus parietis]NYE68769.1 putative kinase [Microlunatus parietis]
MTLHLICGLPGAGKTTLAKKLAAVTGAVRLCPDEWLADLEIDLYDEPARDRLERRLVRLATELLTAGLSVILEYGFWSRLERDRLRDLARELGVRVELHAIVLPVDELWSRIERRNTSGEWRAAPITRAHLDAWARLFEAPTADELALYDAPTPH